MLWFAYIVSRNLVDLSELLSIRFATGSYFSIGPLLLISLLEILSPLRRLAADLAIISSALLSLSSYRQTYLLRRSPPISPRVLKLHWNQQLLNTFRDLENTTRLIKPIHISKPENIFPSTAPLSTPPRPQRKMSRCLQKARLLKTRPLITHKHSY